MAIEPEVEVEDASPDVETTSPADSVEEVDASPAPSTESDPEDGNEESPFPDKKLAPEAKTKDTDEAASIAGIIERTLRANQTQAERTAAQAAEREKIALMTPEQKESYDLKQQLQAMRQEQLGMKIQHAESLDKISIKSDPKMGPLFKKYETQVEEKIKELRSQNNFTNRESVLRWVLGGVMLDAKASGGPSKQKNAGAENIKKSTASPTTARGQVKVVGGKDANSASARAERLANIRI